MAIGPLSSPSFEPFKITNYISTTLTLPGGGAVTTKDIPVTGLTTLHQVHSTAKNSTAAGLTALFMTVPSDGTLRFNFGSADPAGAVFDVLAIKTPA